VLIRQLEGTDTEPEPSTGDIFTDVGTDVWWAGYVERLSELELTRGCGSGDSFCPDQQLTRGQAARLIADAFGLTTDDTAGFSDIADSPHTAAINALFAAGVTLGCGSNPLRFCPDEPITLQQIASLITRAAEAAAEEAEAPEPEPVFEDLEEISETHRDAVNTLTENGIFDEVGCETNQLCPDEPITRWQFAVVIVRQLDGVDAEISDDDDADDADGDADDDTDAEFDDVDGEAWWAGYVERLSELELTRGCDSDGDSFCPDQMLTRGQAAHIIVDAFGLMVPTDDTAEFSDIADSPHAAAIKILFSVGITKGCSTEPLQFCPDEPITRQQIASMINRAAMGLD